MRNRLFLALSCVVVLRLHGALASPILVEAEGFAEPGGWVVDSQFMDTMGSPYLLAHGLGVPVADARARVEVAEAGEYRVWVRTMDWVARWGAPGTPGRFEVRINGRKLEPTFGTVGAKWHWQDGGTVSLPQASATISLHDLTGFEGRCDAIVLSRDPDFTPPNTDPEMAAFRRACLGLPDQPESVGNFDFVVTGGGIAGTCAALSAARLGLKVALIQDRPVLGGNNSSEVRVWLHGARNKEPWPRIGDVVAELEQDRRAHYGPSNTADLYEDDKKLAVVRAEPNITLMLEHRVNAVEMAEGRIKAVIAQEVRSGRRLRVAGRWFADCTGDACVGALAGADLEIQATDHMGPCNLWNVCECTDLTAIGTDTDVAAEPVSFPRCPWALDLTDRPFPGRSKDKPQPDKLGGWYWESGFDRDPIEEMEYIRDWNFRAMYGAWDAMKNVDKVLPNHRLNWAAYILGKRESRRLMGDVVLGVYDLEQDREFPDGCVPTGWSNDIHHPDPRYEGGFEGDAFISSADFGSFPAHQEGRPFWIPFRCLYSRNVPNLMMAGRDVSVTHDALGAVRVMRTGGCMGEILGMAASLCRRHDTDPRGVYEDHLGELQNLMQRGVGKAPAEELSDGGQPQPVRLSVPEWLKSAGKNLAREAVVSTPGSPVAGVQTQQLLNDGEGRVEDNSTRWLQRAPLPHVVELHWNQPVELGAARIISGYYSASGVTAPIRDFTLEWLDGAQWKLLTPGIRGNANPAWATTFAPVKTRAVRLTVTATQNDISRIWEIECYAPAGAKPWPKR